MKILVLFVLLVLIMVVNGWAAFLQPIATPIALSLGAAFAALNSDGDLLRDVKNLFSRDREEYDKEMESMLESKTSNVHYINEDSDFKRREKSARQKDKIYNEKM